MLFDVLELYENLSELILHLLTGFLYMCAPGDTSICVCSRTRRCYLSTFLIITS